MSSDGGWLTADHIRAGDVISKYRQVGPMPSTYNIISGPRIVKVVKTGTADNFTLSGEFTCGMELGKPSRRWEWYVEKRSTETVTPAVAAVSQNKKVIDDFPEKCPRCGADAYVGSWEVAHRNEQAAAGCPARRV